MRVLNGTADLVAAVGEKLGTSDWLVVDQQRIDTFADATGDHQWIHVDPEQAAKGPFGTTIAHGYLTLSLVSEFIHQIFEIHGFKMAVNYGLNKVRFPSPVPVGSKIRGVVTVVNATALHGGAEFILSIVVQVDGSDKPACVAETVVRYFE